MAQSAVLAKTALLPEVRAASEPKLKVRTTFERFEFKYWITEPEADRVLAFAAPYLVRDPYCTSLDSQRNTTLYLDTRGYRFCESHDLLSPDRSKLRIRAYGLPFSDLAFFEVKRKVKTITVKDRFPLPIAEVANVLGKRAVVSPLSKKTSRSLENFIFLMTVHRAQPKVYVACYRDAFESRGPEEDVRLTIDRELVYQPATDLAFAPDKRRWIDIREGDDTRPSFGKRRAMLELKFQAHPPAWMVEMVSRFNFIREAFSKYTTAVLQMRGRI